MISAATPPPVPEAVAPQRRLLAPVWHTAGLVILILASSAASYFSSRHYIAASSAAPPRLAMVVTYASTLVLEWVLFLYVYLGEKIYRGTRILQRIGGRWASARDVWRDIAIALGLWLVLLGISALSNYLFHPKGGEVVLKLLPRDAVEVFLWLLVCVSAGFCEEYVFRGYLQEQFRLLTGTVWIAVVLQAIVFGFGHGYQGVTLMLTIVVFGLLIGSTAAWRKSLRPVMLAHGWLDFIEGFAFYVAHTLHRI